MLFWYAVTLHQCFSTGGDKMIDSSYPIHSPNAPWGCWKQSFWEGGVEVFLEGVCEFTPEIVVKKWFCQLSGLWNFPKLTREWGASGVRRSYTGECYEQKTIRNRKGADRLEKHWKEGRANEGDAVNRYLSFFLFVVSLLLVWTRGHSCPLSCRLSQCSFLWSKDQGHIWASFTSLNRGRGLWHD